MKATNKPFKGVLNQSGLSLVELMISITIGLLIMAGVLQLYATSSVNARTSQGASRIQENVRYAMTRIGDDIAQAGNIKCAAGTAITGMMGVNDTDGSVDGSWDDFDSSYVSGTNNAGGADPLTGSDRLVVKYVDYSTPYAVSSTPSVTTIALADATGLVGGETIAAGNCTGMAIFSITAGDITGNIITATAPPRVHNIDVTNAAASLYAGNTGAYTYFIDSGASGTCSATEQQHCSLFRAKNGAVGGDELVQGIHGLQVRYGRESAGVIAYTDADIVAGLDDIITPAVNESLATIDRVEVTLTFNAPNGAANDPLIKIVTRVFAIRNAW
jgi:type IV pilus assembly protein PilW